MPVADQLFYRRNRRARLVIVTLVNHLAALVFRTKGPAIHPAQPLQAGFTRFPIRPEGQRPGNSIHMEFTRGRGLGHGLRGRHGEPECRGPLDEATALQKPSQGRLLIASINHIVRSFIPGFGAPGAVPRSGGNHRLGASLMADGTTIAFPPNGCFRASLLS